MKAAIVYVLVCVGFIGLVIFSNQPERLKSKGHGSLQHGRRLVVRKLHPSSSSSKQASKHENVAFDPIIANLERKREDRTWEKEFMQHQYKQWADDSSKKSSHDSAPHAESQPEPESEDWDYSDPEAYLNDEEQFNISSRIITLFPLIDNHPPDGIISFEELVDWHYHASLSEAEHRASRELEMYDKNHDGMVSLLEYLPQSASSSNSMNDSMEHGGAGWWKEQFDAADEDGDSLLNATEFNNFLHPQDSHNEKLHQWLRRQQIQERDRDKDGKLNFAEFEHEFYDLVRLYDEESLHKDTNVDSSAIREAGAKRKFSELDKNKDGFLTEDELTPVMDALNPGEIYFAKQQAEYLMSQADKNKDGHLTIEEMLENPYVFYSTAYAYEDYEEHYHDEF